MVYQSKQSAEMEARKLAEQEAGLVSARFSTVKKIRLEVEFHDASGARVQRRCRDYLPDSFALFDMKCPLDSFVFDLKNVVAKMVKGREKEQEGEVKCEGAKIENVHSTSYKIVIDYASKRR